jgi:hypothetical protein
MKNVLSIVACALLCSSLSYAMEEEQNDAKKSHVCADCLEVGPCQWQVLAANLAAMHTGPVELHVAPTPKNDSAAKAESDDWDRISWKDEDWEDLGDTGKEKKD